MAVKGETRVVKAIKEGLEKNHPNCFFFKTHGSAYQRSGIPDLIGCINGRFIGLEVKDPKNKRYGATKLQLYIIDLIKKAGGITGVVTNLEEAEVLINEALCTSKESPKIIKREKEVRLVNGSGNRENPSNYKKIRKINKTKKD